MATQKIEGQLEIDHDRGVIYFHANKGYTALRIGGLPQCIPFVSPTSALDIAHMHGCSWRQPKQRTAANLMRRIRELEEQLLEAGSLMQAARFSDPEPERLDPDEIAQASQEERHRGESRGTDRD